VLGTINRSKRKFVILDACRNDPIPGCSVSAAPYPR
jgi:hypothetical protein